jgi:molybdate transport system substrate-binding protein
MKKFEFCVLTAVFFFFLAGGAYAAGGKIMAFCGSASEVPMEEAARVFEQKTGIKVELNWGGSGSVMSQMKLAKRGDLFIPGSPDYMDMAIAEGLVDPNTVKIIAYLVPTINVQKGNPLKIKELKDLTRPGVRVAIGNPESVCVGLYAVEVLEKNGLLKAVEKNIVTHGASCSSTAALINLKKVDAILGWNVFEQWNPDKTESIFLRPDQVPRLAYIPAAITKTFAENRAGAQAFIDFLASPQGQAIFTKYGYPASEKEVRKFAPKAKIGGEYTLPKEYRTF